MLTLALVALLAMCHDGWALYTIQDPDASREEPGSRLWPIGQGIPVCWQGDDIDPQGWIPSLIRYRVENLWGRYANIWFMGWHRCDATTLGKHAIVIKRIYEHPSHSEVGRQYDNFTGKKPRPTYVYLVFDGTWFCELFEIVSGT
jgi:hypothetical protein